MLTHQPPQFRSTDEQFEPICSRVTKDECAKARRRDPNTSSPNFAALCDRVHFRPLIRPHTDVSLGHCSYLNTCYSEPTYAQSPSIPPFPGSAHGHGQVLPPNARGPVSLPSGLGAGGRGKEKAPCRYLHYEVDWDGSDGELARNPKKDVVKKKIHKLGIGMGPAGNGMRVVSLAFSMLVRLTEAYSFRRNGLIVIYAVLTTLFLVNSTLLWPIHLGTYT